MAELTIPRPPASESPSLNQWQDQIWTYLTNFGGLAQVDNLDDVPDGTSYGRVGKTYIGEGRILLTEATGDLDDISDGDNYGKVALTSITAGKIIVAGLDSGVTVRMFTDSTTQTNIEAWRHASDVTLIDGGDIYANSITLTSFEQNVYDSYGPIVSDPTFALTASASDSNFWDINGTDTIWNAAYGEDGPGVRIEADGTTNGPPVHDGAGGVRYVPASKNDTFIFQVRIKKDTDFDGDVRCYVGAYDENKANPSWPYTAVSISATDTWETHTVEVSISNSNCHFAYLAVLVTGGSTGYVYIDSVHIQPDFSDYGRVATTAISGGKIVLTGDGVTGSLSVTYTDADVTGDNQGNINGSNIVNGEGWTDDTTADTKVVTFYQSGIPTALDAGDIWMDSDDDKVYRATSIGDDQITAGEWELVSDLTSSNSQDLDWLNGASGTLTLSSSGSISVEAADGVIIKSGADIKMESGGDINFEPATGQDPSDITWTTLSTVYTLSVDYDYDRLAIFPDTGGTGEFAVGYNVLSTATPFDKITMRSDTQTLFRNVVTGTNYSEVDLDANGVDCAAYYDADTFSRIRLLEDSTPTITLETQYDANDFAKITMNGDTSSDITIEVETAGTNNHILITNAGGVLHFQPDTYLTGNIGSDSYAWDEIYGDNFNNKGDFFHFDIYDDIQALLDIMPSGEKDPDSGHAVIDDATLPSWLVYKKQGVPVLTPDGKNYLELKACISLSWGAIRQVVKEVRPRIIEINDTLDIARDRVIALEQRVEALENA